MQSKRKIIPCIVLVSLFFSSCGKVDLPRADQALVETEQGIEPTSIATDSIVDTEPQEALSCSLTQPANFRLDLQGLLHTWKANSVAASPYDASNPVGPLGLPQHIQINFDVDHPGDKKLGDPVIYIIPVNDYQALFETAGDASVDQSLEQAEELLTNKSMPLQTRGMQVLPFEETNGENDLVVQGKYLEFDWFSGVRFVGRFTQEISPVVNEGLFYIFQGLNKDGGCLISMFYPVNTAALPDSNDDMLGEELQRVDEDNQAYMADMAAKLNNLAESDWGPDLLTLDSLVGSLQYVSPEEAEASFIGKDWMWTGLVETEPPSQSIISEPQKYKLNFLADGRLQVQADCVSGTGSYTLEDSILTIELGDVVLVECASESLSDQFIMLLVRVSTYTVEQDQLTLSLAGDQVNMLFTSDLSAVRTISPSSTTAIATALTAVHVRSGPGTDYPSYGIAPAGSTAEIIGVSENRIWWVIKVSTQSAPDGRGWVSANYVATQNTENVPVVEPPPLSEVEVPAPVPGSPTAYIVQAVNIRSGPGIEYSSYGIAPKGSVATIIGKSEDGRWWVLSVSTNFAVTGMGWVDANYVNAENAEGVPIIASP